MKVGLKNFLKLFIQTVLNPNDKYVLSIVRVECPRVTHVHKPTTRRWWENKRSIHWGFVGGFSLFIHLKHLFWNSCHKKQKCDDHVIVCGVEMCVRCPSSSLHALRSSAVNANRWRVDTFLTPFTGKNHEILYVTFIENVIVSFTYWEAPVFFVLFFM